MKKLLLSILLLLLLCTQVNATSVDLQWDANTETDLDGYKVLYVADSNDFANATIVDVKNITTATINNLDPSKSYNFAVKAYNTVGMESSLSNIVNVPELLSPIVVINLPNNSTELKGTTSIIAEATDNVGVTKVELYIDGILTATQIELPYTFSWDTSPLKAGQHIITVKAYDAAGNVGETSKTVTIHETPNSPRNLKWKINITAE